MAVDLAIPTARQHIHRPAELRAGRGERAARIRGVLELKEAKWACRSFLARVARGGDPFFGDSFHCIDLFVVRLVVTFSGEAFVAQDAPGRKVEAPREPLPEQLLDGACKLLHGAGVERVTQTHRSLRVASLMPAVAFVVGAHE